MQQVIGQVFGKEQVAVDGKVFEGCTFNNTRLLYQGTAVPTFNNCTFTDVSLEFEGAAESTLQFLGGLYENGFERAVETIFKHIRQA
ncbi:MAG: hypothetical protein AAFR67_00400 [Chloroflexota bacterium]